MEEHAIPQSTDLQRLVEQMAAQMAELRAQMDQQRIEHQQQLTAQQAEIAELRERTRARAEQTTRGGTRASSRRALLKWGGAAAAAAAVTLVASEQSAHAAPTTDGGNVVLGTTTTAEHPTVVKYDGTAGNAKVIFLVNDSPFVPSNAAFSAALGGWVSGSGTSGNVTGVYGFSGVDSGNGVVGNSALGPGMHAETFDTRNGSPALSAKNLGSGYGIDATGSDNAIGVLGQVGGTSGVAVYGIATGSSSGAVFGRSDDGFGVIGSSDTGIAIAAYGTGRIWQQLYGGLGAPSSGSHFQGESVRDSLGDLYLCVAGGSPGAWKKVAAIPAGKPGGALVFLHAPFRIFDTCPGVAGCPIDPGVPMTSGAVTTLQVTGTASTTDSTLVVPTGATGIIGDLLAINVNGNGITGGFAGFLTLQPHNVTPTGNSYLHYYPATIQHNCVVMGLDTSGKLDVGNYNTATNVGLDITGYII